MPVEFLKIEIQYLKGIGSKKAEVLQKELNIYVVEDLIYYFPYKYIDKTKFYSVNQIDAHLPYIQLKGKISNFQTIGQARKQRLTATFTDNTGSLELIWFKGIKWVKESIKINVDYILFGKPSSFNNKINIVHPEIEEITKHDEKLQFSFLSLYNTSEKLKKKYINSKAIHNIQQSAFSTIKGYIPETLPNYLIEKLNLVSLDEALFNVHFPQSIDLLKKSRYRLKFEELFYVQLNILKQKILRKEKFKGYVFSKVGDYFNTFYSHNLPFSLTNAQKRVVKEIRRDVGSGKQMNRLLQGDVGSGKTLVALMAILIAVDNNYQACFMAPTEILAIQHFKTLSKMLDGLDININLLTGSTKKAQRKIIHEQLLSGELKILIGTHALIEDVVKFKNLGMVVIDEQHRFGVAQRALMWKKNINPPHILVMTATPIPRTLAMTVYGDLEVSVIDEMPPGRKPVKTIHYYDSKRLRVFGFIEKQIQLGRQIYIVYPLIKESEKMDYKDLEDGLESISRAFPSPKYSISVVHGKMKPAEKEKSMQLFVKGQTQIMVATTVIEVGVDVSNASVMIIESAERFGLSQLHQLRGRVGRGGDQSYCILMTSYKLSNDGRKRIETMVQTNDGFEISEVDLKLRGPGDIEGTQQSGIPFDFKIANLSKDTQILQYARNIANDILENDASLNKEENQILVKQLKKLSKDNVNWGYIS
ncbi:MAG: ATP-dependent DNA helicase RecG [Bacteroidetes bacterium]|nr:ATP-dependent DNA helicase RecG [Bacteroidota bacterium]